ncbi:unnamed protein product, partial [Clonostachys rosea f. rosea IK726]
MPASDEVPVDRSGDDASSYSEDGVHGNVSDAPPAEEPPADDADAVRGGAGCCSLLGPSRAGCGCEWASAGQPPVEDRRARLFVDASRRILASAA